MSLKKHACFSFAAIASALLVFGGVGSLHAQAVEVTVTVHGQIQLSDEWSNSLHKPMYYFGFDGNGNPNDGYCNNGGYPSRETALLRLDTGRIHLRWAGPDGIYSSSDDVDYGWISETAAGSKRWIGSGAAAGVEGRVWNDGKSLSIRVPLALIGNPETLEVGFMTSPWTTWHLDLLGPGNGCAQYPNGWLVIPNTSGGAEYTGIDGEGDYSWPIGLPNRGPNFDIFMAGVQIIPDFQCAGFEPPMDVGPVTVKGKNRALPFKAELYDADGYAVTDANIPAPPVIQVIYDPGGGEHPYDVSDDALPAGQSTEGNQFFFSEEGKWQYNLKVKNFTASGVYYVEMVAGSADESSPVYRVSPRCSSSFEIR